MIYIFSEQESPRLSYIVDLVFTHLLGIKFQIICDQNLFLSSNHPKLNYSNLDTLPGVQLKPWSLLFETDIKIQDASKAKPWYGLPTLTINTEDQFDPFAMSFYLVSRYEEYGNFEPDVHNRFPAEASCLTKNDLLHKPLVNLWANRIMDVLKDKYPDLAFNPRQYEYLSTIDIDQAWKYRNKGVMRNWLSGLNELRKREWSEFSNRLSVLSGYSQDPFFNYEWQNEIHKKYQTKVQYFIQVGSYGKFDKNISLHEPSFKNLIGQLDEEYDVGMHPSYQSNKQPERIAKEKKALEHVVNHPITVSRQHYLMHTMPLTYERLIENGIVEDHTMGYSTHVGFRAGIAAPFYFFNLKTNRATTLKLVPFCLMDITPLHYLQLNPEEAENVIADIIWETKNVNGMMVTLWHNESLSEDGRWKGWRSTYEVVQKMAN